MPSKGPKVAGHTATLVGNEMYIIGGYDRILGFNERSYIYNIDTKEWKNLTTSGPSPKGLYFTEILYFNKQIMAVFVATGKLIKLNFKCLRHVIAVPFLLFSCIAS